MRLTPDERIAAKPARKMYKTVIATVALASFAISGHAHAAPASEDQMAGSARTIVSGSPSSETDAGHPLVVSDLEPWLDGLMPTALASAGIAGAGIVVVKDGQVFFQKGYGKADLSTHRTIDPETTLFRVGSVTKLFTWTAVMQLVEKGDIDLDVDVNHYLDFAIPKRQGGPITMRHLMTHTAGFEEARRGLATLDADRIIPLREALKPNIPQRVYAVGSTPAYSNFGAALAGYIVERVSGEPFDDYIERNILGPLDMRHTTLRQPLPASLAPDMSKGYRTNASLPGKFENVLWQPAGSMSATVTDMAHFMIAHLQEGAYGDTSIMSPETARMMHDTPYKAIPGINAMELGFYEKNINGRRVIGHEGDTVLFHSLLALYLDDNVGLFVTLNSAGVHGGASRLREQLFEQFSDRYLPGPVSENTGIDRSVAQAHNRMFAHAYRNSRSSHSSFMAALNLLFPIRVIANDDDTISLSGYRGAAGDNKRFEEISPFVWNEIDGHDRIVGIIEDGHIARISTNQTGAVMVLESVPSWASPHVLKPLFSIGVLSLCMVLFAWPVRSFVKHKYGGASSFSPSRVRAERMMQISALAALVSLAGWTWLLLQIMDPSGIYQLAELSGYIYGLELVSILGFGGAFAAAAYLAFVVWRQSAGWGARIGSLVLLLGTASMLYTALLYHLLTLSAAF
jgi:CubicO group peptidase (beta-lactamase class C family)